MESESALEASAHLVEHFFRHESGRLTAVLLKRFGGRHLGHIEDAIQHALERALATWKRSGVPNEPSAWLTRVAQHHVLDRLRQERTAEQHASRYPELDSVRPGDGADDYLALLFACADERLAPRARLVLCLKLLSGFSTSEIADRLFMSAANVQKILERGRRQLARDYNRHTATLGETESSKRLETVQLVLYLQFNEGYSLGPGERGLRVELCEEAIRLTRLLATNPQGDRGSSWGLLALMHLNAARLSARISPQGQLVPLERQDRSLWDGYHVRLGLEAIQVAAQRGELSRYTAEATIQMEHILAPSFEETRFSEIVSMYEALERLLPSPVYALNRVIALAEVEGPQAAALQLESDRFPRWFRDHYLYQGTLGELLRRQGKSTQARHHLLQAARAAPSHAERLHFEHRASLA